LRSGIAPIGGDIGVVPLRRKEIVPIGTDGGVNPMTMMETDIDHLERAVGIGPIRGREVGLHERIETRSQAAATIGNRDALGLVLGRPKHMSDAGIEIVSAQVVAVPVNRNLQRRAPRLD
jgi:hypothetical protein